MVGVWVWVFGCGWAAGYDMQTCDYRRRGNNDNVNRRVCAQVCVSNTLKSRRVRVGVQCKSRCVSISNTLTLKSRAGAIMAILSAL
jgi:hypothetical protein